MAERLILMVRHESETLAVNVSGQQCFSYLVGKVHDRWPNTPTSGLRFRYSIANYRNCMLFHEADYESLILLVEAFKLSVVDLDVLTESSCLHHHNNEQVNQNNSESHVSESNCNINPLDGVCAEDNAEQFSSKESSKKEKVSDSWFNNITGVGQKFLGGKKEFRAEIAKNCSMNGFNFHFMKNNNHRIYVVCANKDSVGCKWQINATSKKLDPVFTITKCCLQHSCTDLLIKDHTKRLNPKVMAPYFVQDVLDSPLFGGAAIKNQINNNYGFVVDYSKAWRTLRAARESLYGSYKDSFNQLRWYAEAVKETNPGSLVELKSNSATQKFESFFVAFDACLKGFKFCRPMVFIDSTSLKGRFKGQLLTATSKDGDNGLFPLAMAIVDCENIPNWTWFITKLKETLLHDKEIFYLSDRHAGIMAAFPKVFDEPVHFYCMMHLYTNLKGRYNSSWSTPFRKKMVKLFKDVAYAPTITLFDAKMTLFMETGGPQALAFLEDLPYDKWALAYSPRIVRYGEMTSNAAESFNQMIKPYRALPVCYLIDAIRQHIMDLYRQRLEMSAQWSGALTPKQESRWNGYRIVGRSWKIVKSNRKDLYEVLDPEASQVVDLSAKTCTCHEWQIQGFPCKHAVNVIAVNLTHISGIVDSYFFTPTYRQSYKETLHPVPTSLRAVIQQRFSGDQKILPPDTRVTAGRPKRKRILSFGEVPKRSVKIRQCPNCNKPGRHDPVTCGAQLHNEFPDEVS